MKVNYAVMEGAVAKVYTKTQYSEEHTTTRNDAIYDYLLLMS